MTEERRPRWDPDHPDEPYDPLGEGALRFVHRTRPRFEPKEARHECPDGSFEKDFHGPAIITAVKAGGVWWATTMSMAAGFGIARGVGSG